MLLNGAEILIKSLLEQGVDTIFGYPGGAVLNIYDALYMHQDEIRHVLTCHEQGASHAADGYARSTGKVGVCLATSGPGATNLVTGIATAYMDSVPMVAITGNVQVPLLGKDSFQEVDISGITMPITKHNYIVKDVKDLHKIVREAFYIAQEGRPGPVLIDIPKDVTANKAIYEPMEPIKVERKSNYIEEEAIERVANLINESEKPFIYAGGGVISSGACEELLAFAEKINAPTSTTLMAMGAIPSDHKLFTGMIGMHGTKASNLSATDCDLLIAIGARFSDRVISNRSHVDNAKIIHIDVDPAEINKNVKADEFIVGDIKLVLNKLLPLLNNKCNEAWIEKTLERKNLKGVTYDEEDERLNPEFIFETLHSVIGENSIVTTEVGQHQMWTAQYFGFNRPRSFVTSGGLGTMGYGLGASIGCQVGNPDKKVVNVAGDGSFMMNCNEIATAVTNKLPIIMMIINNNCLGMVRQWQNLFYAERYSQTTLNRETDLVKLADAYGARGYRVSKKSELKGVLEEAVKSQVPVLIDCQLNIDTKVFPMVAPGAPINQIITESDLK